MWELDYKESWVPKNWCFCTMVLEKTLESPMVWMRTNQSILKDIFIGRTDAEAELQYSGHLMQRTYSLEKTLMLRKTEGRKRRGNRGWDGWWHYWLNWHEFEQAPGVGDGQGSLACCSSWGHKELDWATELILYIDTMCEYMHIQNFTPYFPDANLKN